MVVRAASAAAKDGTVPFRSPTGKPPVANESRPSLNCAARSFSCRIDSYTSLRCTATLDGALMPIRTLYLVQTIRVHLYLSECLIHKDNENSKVLHKIMRDACLCATNTHSGTIVILSSLGLLSTHLEWVIF